VKFAAMLATPSVAKNRVVVDCSTFYALTHHSILKKIYPYKEFSIRVYARYQSQKLYIKRKSTMSNQSKCPIAGGYETIESKRIRVVIGTPPMNANWWPGLYLQYD
jgi:hypothetical protein